MPFIGILSLTLLTLGTLLVVICYLHYRKEKKLQPGFEFGALFAFLCLSFGYIFGIFALYELYSQLAALAIVIPASLVVFKRNGDLRA